MSRIAVTYGGTYFHHQTYCCSPFAEYVDELLYLPELVEADLQQFDAVMVSCRSNPRFLQPLADRWLEYLQSGGTLVVFADTGVQNWLPKLEFHPKTVNHWWWLDPDAEHDIQPKNLDHSLFQYLSHGDMTWHYHGTFTPPEGATVLLQHPDGTSVLFDDRNTYAGRLIVTTLDPSFHHGSHFMPAATRFLHGFLPWLRQQVMRA